MNPQKNLVCFRGWGGGGEFARQGTRLKMGFVFGKMRLLAALRYATLYPESAGTLHVDSLR